MMTSLLAAVMAGSLVLYVLLGGADYGAGFWDLFSRGPSKQEQRDLIASAIRPIWEANHVWLILILVLLFAGFPRAFGAIMIALFVPILLVLLGIVLRGSSFVFRAYSTMHTRTRRAWAYVFSASSSFTPIFAGVVAASLSDDHLRVANDESLNGYVFNWLNPFSVCVGLFTLALFAYLAAAYLTVEAPSPGLREDFRRRAFAAGLVTACLAVANFALTGWYARGLRESLVHSGFALCAGAASVISLIVAELAIYKSLVNLARRMTAIFAAFVVIGWTAAQYPYLSRPDMTIFNSVLSENVVRDVFFASMAGALLLFPSLGLLLYVFKDQRKERAIEEAEKLRV